MEREQGLFVTENKLKKRNQSGRFQRFILINPISKIRQYIILEEDAFLKEYRIHLDRPDLKEEIQTYVILKSLLNSQRFKQTVI